MAMDPPSRAHVMFVMAAVVVCVGIGLYELLASRNQWTFVTLSTLAVALIIGLLMQIRSSTRPPS